MEFSLLKMLTIMISTIFLNVFKERFFYPGLFPCPSSLSLKYSKEQYSEKNR